MSVSDYNTDPDSNTTISGINIAEGCPPSGINNAIRQMMADVKTLDGTLVHTSGAETIAGAKTFSSTTTLTNVIRGIDTDGLAMSGGSASTSARLRLNGKDAATNPGRFTLTADDNSNNAALIGDPSGSLLWANKAVERVQSISVSNSDGYIRFVSGLQIVWGNTGTISAQKAVTFGQSFSHVPIVLTGSNVNTATYATSVTTTGFKANCGSYSGSPNVRWIAIGDWV